MKKTKKWQKITLLSVMLLALLLAPLQSFAEVMDNGVPYLEVFTESSNGNGEYHDFLTTKAFKQIAPNTEGYVLSRSSIRNHDTGWISSFITNYMIPAKPSNLAVPQNVKTAQYIHGFNKDGLVEFFIEIETIPTSNAIQVVITTEVEGETKVIHDKLFNDRKLYTVGSTLRITDDGKIYIDLVTYGHNENGTLTSHGCAEQLIHQTPLSNLDYTSFNAYIWNNTNEYFYCSVGTTNDRLSLGWEHPKKIRAVEQELNGVISSDFKYTEEDLVREHAYGYQEGKEVGKEEGYNNGYNAGLVDGIEQGFDDGYADGTSQGYDEGYAKGSADGYNTGYNKGKKEGLDEGFLLGKDNSDTIPKAFDTIGKYAAKSLTIFASHGNIFGYSMLDLIAGICAVGVALWLVKKVL